MQIHFVLVCPGIHPLTEDARYARNYINVPGVAHLRRWLPYSLRRPASLSAVVHQSSRYCVHDHTDVLLRFMLCTFSHLLSKSDGI